MKKFLVAIIVCLSVALCSSAMAQGPHRGGPGPGFHGGPGPGFHGGPGPAFRPGPGPGFRPAPPPPGPGFYRPVPPPPPPRYYPNYYYPGYYYPGSGLYLNTPGFGFSLSL